MRYLILRVLAAIMFLMLTTVPVAATSIIFDLDFEFSGGDDPDGAAPWATATFDDHGSPGSVTLTMDLNFDTDYGDFVTQWYFNFFDDTNKVSVDALEFSYESSTGPEAEDITITTGENEFKADGDGYYDILFEFGTSKKDRFDGDEMVIYTIMASGLTADMFDTLSFGSSQGFPTAAKVQGIGEDEEGSGWIAPSPVPESATMLLLGMGLVGLAGLGKKKLIKKEELKSTRRRA